MKKYIAAGAAAVIVLVAVAFGIKSCVAGKNVDAGAYVQAQLDLTFQGETQEARRYVDASETDLHKIYENGISAFVENYLTGDVDTEGAFTDIYGELTEQIFRSMRYRIGEAAKTGKNTFEVQVFYQPADVFPVFLPELKEASARIEEKGKSGAYGEDEEERSQAMFTEYLNQSYALLEKAYLNMGYEGEAKYTFTVTADKDGITMKNEEIAVFIEKILALDKLE